MAFSLKATYSNELFEAICLIEQELRNQTEQIENIQEIIDTSDDQEDCKAQLKGIFLGIDLLKSQQETISVNLQNFLDGQ